MSPPPIALHATTPLDQTTRERANTECSSHLQRSDTSNDKWQHGRCLTLSDVALRSTANTRIHDSARAKWSALAYPRSLRLKAHDPLQFVVIRRTKCSTTSSTPHAQQIVKTVCSEFAASCRSIEQVNAKRQKSRAS